jgi:hypothetical protein
MFGQQARRRRTLRTATALGAGVVVVFGLTGCTEGSCASNNPIVSFLYCRAEADSHSAPPGSTGPVSPESAPPPRSLSVVASARLFSARLNARAVQGHPGVLQQHGAVQSVRGMIVAGRFNGSLAHVRPAPPADALLRRLLRSGYRARLDASLNMQTSRGVTKMLALATITRRSQACLRITIVEQPGRRPAGTFRVLGGTGDVTRLSAAGTFSFKRGGASMATGRVRSQLVAARGLPRACAALGRT